MPRIRTIKPEFFRHHDLYLAEQKSNLPLRVAFSGLWCCCDKEGRFKWKPTQLKLDVLPYDVLNFELVLSTLQENDFIVKYIVGGKEFGFIPTFKDHQRITGSEKDYESKLPDPKGNIVDFQSVSLEDKSVTKGDILQSVDCQHKNGGNISDFQSDTKETLWISGKEEGYRKGEIGKEVLEGKNFPTMTSADLEAFQLKLIKDDMFIEQLMMSKGIKTKKEIIEWVGKYNVHITGEGKLNKDFGEYKRHFKNWVVRQDTFSSSTPNRPVLQSQKTRAEIEKEMAEWDGEL